MRFFIGINVIVCVLCTRLSPDDYSWDDAKNEELRAAQGFQRLNSNSGDASRRDELRKLRLDHLRRSTSRFRDYAVSSSDKPEDADKTIFHDRQFTNAPVVDSKKSQEFADELTAQSMESAKLSDDVISRPRASQRSSKESAEGADGATSLPSSSQLPFKDVGAGAGSSEAPFSWQDGRNEELRSMQNDKVVDSMKQELRTIRRLRHIRNNTARLAETTDDFFRWMKNQAGKEGSDPDQDLMEEIDRMRAKLCGGSKRLQKAPLDHKQCTEFMDDRCRKQDKTTGEGWCKKWKKLASKACKSDPDRDICKGYIDTDNDGVVDSDDVFPEDPKEWEDTDKDGVGNNADACPNDPDEQKDTDGDGVCDNSDAFPEDPKEQKDSDGDGVGDNSDAFPLDPQEQKDSDKDGVGDKADAFPMDPKEQKDSDGDGVGDNSDAFPDDPKEHADTDKDGVGDNSDACPNDPNDHKDTDGDKVCDYADAFPEDPTEQKDTDNDGVGDNADAFPEDPNEQKDSDGDGVGDKADACPEDPTDHKDSDGDGVCDASDEFPDNPEEQKDTDGDGVGDHADKFPYDPKEWADCGGDGIGDNADKDCDGVVNEHDAFPDNGKEWKDTDGDGVGDNGDAHPHNKECFNASLPCEKPMAPPPKAKWPETSNQKKEDKMYPSQGYGEYSRGSPVSGDWVQHDDKKTATADWGKEWPKRDETEHVSIAKICEEHPGNEWCSRYHRQKGAEEAHATGSWFR